MPNGTTADYKYDPFGRRIEKAVTIGGVTTTSRYIYDGPNIMAEYDASNAVVNKYTHNLAIDDPLALQTGGQTYYYHKDAQGTVTQITDTAGATVQTYAYDAYGNIKTPSIAIAQPYLYTGREYDPETGLYFYRARQYDAKTGRFLQKDPIGFSAGDVNVYRYVQNNAVNWIDPLGLERKPGKTPPSLWPNPPVDVCGKKPKWNPQGFWEGKGRRLTWDDRAHGAGVDRGNGPQDGHWDDESSNDRWDRNGRPLPSTMLAGL